MLVFEEGLESSPSFWKVVFQTKCQKLAEPTTLHKTTHGKVKENNEE